MSSLMWIALHGRHLPHLGRGHVTEDGAVPVHDAPLPGRIRKELNPHVVDVDCLAEDVAALAERWSRQPAVKRRRTA
jgi:hypothetical protein